MPLSFVCLLLWYSWPKRTIFRPLNSACPEASCYCRGKQYRILVLDTIPRKNLHIFSSGSGPWTTATLCHHSSWPDAFLCGWESTQMCGYLVKPGLAWRIGRSTETQAKQNLWKACPAPRACWPSIHGDTRPEAVGRVSKKWIYLNFWLICTVLYIEFFLILFFLIFSICYQTKTLLAVNLGQDAVASFLFHLKVGML